MNLRRRIKQAFCRHETVRFVSATATEPYGDWSGGFGNGVTGVGVLCCRCGWNRWGDVVSAMAPLQWMNRGVTVNVVNGGPS